MICLFEPSTCFEQLRAHPQENNCIVLWKAWWWLNTVETCCHKNILCNKLLCLTGIFTLYELDKHIGMTNVKLTACQAYPINLYKNLRSKLLKCCAKICFNKQCLTKKNELDLFFRGPDDGSVESKHVALRIYCVINCCVWLKFIPCMKQMS